MVKKKPTKDSQPREFKPLPAPGPLDFFKGLAYAWAYRRWGIRGLIISYLFCLLAAAGLYVWWNWDQVRTRPGVALVVAWLGEKPIPKADPNRFSVGVALLENDDEKNDYHRLLISTLSEFEGIQVLPLPRTISAGVVVPDTGQVSGHELARDYLRQTNANALLWGDVLRNDQTSIARLHWTVTDRSAGKDWKRYPPTKDLSLPELFWSDLKEVILLVVATGHSRFQAQKGRSIADQLLPFINKCKRLLQAGGDSVALGNQEAARIRSTLAESLTEYGIQVGDKGALMEGVAYYREILRDWTADREPLAWAITQQNLGSALTILGQMEIGIARLEEAVAVFREALKVLTRDRVPVEWARTQNNLGNVLASIGERLQDTTKLEEAAAAFREALQVRTRERMPLAWALTQINLGSVLASLGELEQDTTKLEEAAATFRLALTESTVENAPVYWALAYNNLGTVLASLGRRGAGTGRFEEAVTAYQKALQVRTRERMPLDWAISQGNLGNALAEIGARRNDSDTVCTSLNHQIGALEVFTNAPAEHHRKRMEETIRVNARKLRSTFGEEAYDRCVGQDARLRGFL